MAAQNKIEMNQTIFQFTVTDINGDSFDFCSLEGKKIMIVNTASDCGLTPQYEALQSLYEKYQNVNFIENSDFKTKEASIKINKPDWIKN